MKEMRKEEGLPTHLQMSFIIGSQGQLYSEAKQKIQQ